MRSPKSIYQRKEIVEMGREVSQKLNIPLNVVLMAYLSFYDNIRDKVASFDINDESEDNQLSFNIKHLGKLYTNKELLDKIKERRKNIKYKDESTKY